MDPIKSDGMELIDLVRVLLDSDMLFTEEANEIILELWKLRTVADVVHCCEFLREGNVILGFSCHLTADLLSSARS